MELGSQSRYEHSILFPDCRSSSDIEEQMGVQSQDRSLKAFWGEYRRNSAQTFVLVQYARRCRLISYISESIGKCGPHVAKIERAMSPWRG